MDRPVTLRGGVFALIVCGGGTTDTSRVEPDPGTARRHAGPRDIDSGPDVVQQVPIMEGVDAGLRLGAGLPALAGFPRSRIQRRGRRVGCR
jgi:hypothetical protein